MRGGWRWGWVATFVFGLREGVRTEHVLATTGQGGGLWARDTYGGGLGL